jgi:hypothetical protein
MQEKRSQYVGKTKTCNSTTKLGTNKNIKVSIIEVKKARAGTYFGTGTYYEIN